MKRICLPVCLLLFLLTGCAGDAIADRLYTQAIGLSGKDTLQFTIQGFEEEDARTVYADGIADALRQEEAEAGGRIFLGHTELLCLDGSRTSDTVRMLLFEQGLSPGCKVLYASPGELLCRDSTEYVHALRMAEKNGLLPATELSTVLGEWLGAWETALLPAQDRKLVLLHRDGTCVYLSEEAAAGMCWLRPGTDSFSMTTGAGDAEIRSLELTKTMQDGQGQYHIRLVTQDADDALRRTLKDRVQAECEAAVREMRDAGADVIGLQTLMEAAGMQPGGTLPEVTVTVTVT